MSLSLAKNFQSSHKSGSEVPASYIQDIFTDLHVVKWMCLVPLQDNFAVYHIDQQLRELSSMLPEYSVDGFDNCIDDEDDDDDEDYVDDGMFDGRLVRWVICSCCTLMSL